ncbi:MAG: DNA polymerase III subunit alpha [Acholeplasmatales bacterium]|nr:DNA polymerase III subunit alpha [Acholeplasmatales bacterium]
MKGFLYGQTEYNLLGSSNRLIDYIDYAKECGFDYVSITDKNMHGAYKFYSYAKKNNIKPIIGLEYSFNFGDIKKSKLLLYAKNDIGYHNLMRISTKVLVENIDELKDIKEYKEGLYFIFVYNDSLLEELLRGNEINLLNDVLLQIKEFNGYIGFSNTNYPFKEELNKSIENYAINYGIKCIPIHRCNYLKKEEYKIFETLRKIDGEAYTVGANDFSFNENPLESKELDEIVNSIDLCIYNEKPKLPKFPCPNEESSHNYLNQLCNKGLRRRLQINRVDESLYDTYFNRLEFELSIIAKMGYEDYFLVVWDFIKYSKKNNILVGPGRGSAAGSLVAYSLGITEVDPLKFNLFFERFLNPERVTMPDIDTDFPDNRRDDVINYVKEKYGKLHICNITTFGRFKLKSSIKDLARICDIDISRANKIVDMVEKYGFDYLLEEYENTDKELYDFLVIAKGLDNLPRHISTHAAGIILSDLPLDGIIPLSSGINDLYQSQFEAHDLEEIGLLKMDFLGLSNLTMVSGMMDDSNFSINDLRNIPLNDPKVYNMLSKGDTLGIFQLESEGIRKVLINLKPNCFMDLVATLALYRPGPMDNIPDFIKGKNEGNIKYLHPDLEPILKETYGVIVYQEQIMQIARKFAGFTLGEADGLRRAISKKDSSKLDSLKDDFIKRSIESGYDKDTATCIYDLIYKFANYGFNKSHSVVYAYLAYQMAYFKANYFPVFMGNILNNVISSSKTLASYIRYSRSHGLVIHKPNINVSSKKFMITKEGLFIPFPAILSIGDAVSDRIIEERKKPFISYEDFRERTTFLTSEQITALIFSGALDMFGRTKKSMNENTNDRDLTFSKYINIRESDEYDETYLRKMEYKYLGMNIVYNLFKNKKDIVSKHNLIPLNRVRVGSRVKTLAVFNSINNKNTKKSQEKMIVGMMGDDIVDYKFIIFPQDYVKIKLDIKEDSLYVVFGILRENDKKEIEFIVNDIHEAL